MLLQVLLCDRLHRYLIKENTVQLVEVPFITVDTVIDDLFHERSDLFIDHRSDLLMHILTIENPASLLVHELSLVIIDFIILEKILTD